MCYNVTYKEQIGRDNMPKCYLGRGVIKIAERSEDITKDNIVSIMQKIYPIIKEQHRATRELYGFFLGKQPILDKERPTEEQAFKNNIVVENHAYKLVNFKTSYLVSDGFKYSQSDDKRTDDVTMLNKYFVDEDKLTKDYNIAKWMYVCGHGFRFIRPTANKRANFDGESPFNIVNLDPTQAFIVYSTSVDGEVALSGYVAQTKQAEFTGTVDEYTFTIYTKERVFTIVTNSDDIGYATKVTEEPNVLGENPIIEYALNEARIGVIDVAYSALNSINIITSNQIDDIVDFVNSILVLYNVNIDEKKVLDLRKIGAMQVDDKNPQAQAKVEYVANQLSHSQINELYDRIVKTVYDIVGVPIASGQVTSGGDTGEARKLGNGYESADLVIKLEEAMFISAERKCLKMQLNICKGFKKCRINDLFASEIQINPTRHNLDNILSKVQALAQLNSIGFPEEASLILVGLGANPHELASQWIEKKASLGIDKSEKDLNINHSAEEI